MVSAIIICLEIKKQIQVYIHIYGGSCTLSLLPGGTTCADITCQNGGSCVEVTGGGVECICTSGFIGTQCETRTFQRQLIDFLFFISRTMYQWSKSVVFRMRQLV